MKCVALHVLLGLALDIYPPIATVHALVVLLGACCWVALDKPLERACYASAYIVGSEVLWRMMHATVFWEAGKYGCCAVWLIGLWRMPRRAFNGTAAAYFGLLLPSIAFTLASLDLGRAREEISFNLSGPLALAIGVSFFGNVKSSSIKLDRVFVALLSPLVSTGFITAYRTLTARYIHFGSNSNFTTSGGFGPNQVAAALGLAVFITCFWLLAGNPRSPVKLLLIVLLIFFGVQSAMTFSRGGLYGAGGALLLSSFYLLRDRRRRFTLLIGVPALGLLVAIIILPELDNFTGGRLTSRFQQTQLTHRGDIIEADLRVWFENPLFGVGPGVAKHARSLSIGAPAAHTEVSRLLSEHGLFGLIALVLLANIARTNLASAATLTGKAFVVGTTGWTFLFMLANGMRLAAPALVFGMGCAAWESTRRPFKWRVVSRPASTHSIPVQMVRSAGA